MIEAAASASEATNLLPRFVARIVDVLRPSQVWLFGRRRPTGSLHFTSSFATTYRYPSPTGKRKEGPSNDEVLVWIMTITKLTAEARRALLTASRTHRELVEVELSASRSAFPSCPSTG